LSLGGRWYLGFTVALGVAAIYSGNNVIYLLESLLLSALLVSGVLSEITLSRIRVTRETGNIHAGASGEDVFVVENLGKMPLYCIELGEYSGAQREFTAFLLMVPGMSKTRVRSRQTVMERGRHRWDGLLAATSFPFGFARKVRMIENPGSRIVWPMPIEPTKSRARDERGLRGELEPVPDELVPVEPWQDASRVHWPISMRAGELMARPMRWTQPLQEIWLDLRHPGPEMELAISRATGALISGQKGRADVLVLVSKSERQKVAGHGRALDALALLPKEAG
ncbi:MAG: hypothetical protein ACXVA8_11795, partial [Bdellovibrionota bacterium]